MESRGAHCLRNFTESPITRPSFAVRGKSFFKYYAYFRFPWQINGKMKSKLFRATTSPNGGRSSRREYFISTQPRIRYIATRNCGGNTWEKKIISLKRQADYREQDRFSVTLYRLMLPTTLFSFPPFSLPISISTSVETKSRGELRSLPP